MRARLRKVLVISFAAIGLAALIAAWNQPALLRIGTLLSLLTDQTPTKLAVPVEGVASNDLADTWGAPRGVDRRHEGIDIFAPQGRPVVSTTPGVVFKVGENDLGGKVVRVLGPGWQWHYYAHLDRFGDIQPGSVVQQGTVLGYVGNTGNARSTPPHLHYGVYRFVGGARNPYPLLATDRPVTNLTKSSRSEPKKLKARPASLSKKHARSNRTTRPAIKSTVVRRAGPRPRPKSRTSLAVR